MARNVSTLQRVPLAPAIGAMFGVAAAVLVAAVPTWMFEQAVGSSGVAARLLAIVAAFALVGLAMWGLVRAAERVFADPVARNTDADELDLATFADAIAVAPRRPISADRELGAPLMSDEALQTAVPVTEDAEAKAEPAPAIPSPPLTTGRATGYTSIEELIRRLEIGMARRGPRPPDPTGPGVVPTPVTGSSWIVREDEVGAVGGASERMAAA